MVPRTSSTAPPPVILSASEESSPVAHTRQFPRPILQPKLPLYLTNDVE
jgi:hypothetical protein